MFSRNTLVWIVTALFIALPASTFAQDNPAAALDAVKQSFGKQLPSKLRVTASGSAYQGTGDARKQTRIEPFTQEIDPASPTDQNAVWATPLGFVAGATTRTATMANETLYGTPYRVLTFTAANGQQVKGYLTEKNVLERTRADITDSTGRKVQKEAVFYDWTDFNGTKFPSIIIEKENGEVARILVISKVEAVGGAAPVQSAEK